MIDVIASNLERGRFGEVLTWVQHTPVEDYYEVLKHESRLIEHGSPLPETEGCLVFLPSR